MGLHPFLASGQGYQSLLGLERRRGRKEIITIIIVTFELSADPPAAVVRVAVVSLVNISSPGANWFRACVIPTLKYRNFVKQFMVTNSFDFTCASHFHQVGIKTLL